MAEVLLCVDGRLLCRWLCHRDDCSVVSPRCFRSIRQARVSGRNPAVTGHRGQVALLRERGASLPLSVFTLCQSYLSVHLPCLFVSLSLCFSLCQSVCLSLFRFLFLFLSFHLPFHFCCCFFPFVPSFHSEMTFMVERVSDNEAPFFLTSCACFSFPPVLAKR